LLCARAQDKDPNRFDPIVRKGAKEVAIPLLFGKQGILPKLFSGEDFYR
jgi:hypothetical protein